MRIFSKTTLSLTTAALLAASYHIPSFAGAPFVCPDSTSGAADSTVIGSSCYALFTTASTWSTAKSACASLGGNLAVIRGASENSAVHSIITGYEPWIGAADDDSLVSGSSEGEYFWVGDSAKFWTGGQSGSAVGGAYTNWNGSEPNDSSGEDCMQMYSAGVWNDAECTDSKAYVCQVDAVRDTSSSSSGETGHGGVRGSTLQRLIDASLQRKSSSSSSKSSAKCASQQSSRGRNRKDLLKSNCTTAASKSITVKSSARSR